LLPASCTLCFEASAAIGWTCWAKSTFHYVLKPQLRREAADQLIEAVRNGELVVLVGQLWETFSGRWRTISGSIRLFRPSGIFATA